MTTLDQINQLLPQTQCELCGHKGCKPYAEALLAGEDTIDQCAPGGLPVLHTLGKALSIDPAPFIEHVTQNAKPPSYVNIREAECIGCKKCINACPVDAIIGSTKQMHVIITTDCTGCDLCIPPCPMDCIDTVELPDRPTEETASLAILWQARYDKRQKRLARDKEKEKIAHTQLKEKKASRANTIAARQAEIKAAIARMKQTHER